MPKQSRFAEELNKMLEETSMSAEDVVAQLNKYGFPVPLYTFAYWLQGYFLPRFESAFQMVSALEGIYGITDNRFSDALLEDLSSGLSFVPGESTESGFFATPPADFNYKFSPYFVEPEKTIDWEANLIQKVVRDEIYVSADRTHDHLKTTVLARVPSVPDPTFVLQLLYVPGESPGDGEYVYDLSGIEIRKQEIYERDDVIICATRFSLPDNVVPGDLHTLSYSWDEYLQAPREKIGERLLPWTLDFYSCKVTFEGRVPEDIRYATFELFEGEEVEVPCDIPIVRSGNTVSISAKNFGNCVGAFCCSVQD